MSRKGVGGGMSQKPVWSQKWWVGVSEGGDVKFLRQLLLGKMVGGGDKVGGFDSGEVVRSIFMGWKVERG